MRCAGLTERLSQHEESLISFGEKGSNAKNFGSQIIGLWGFILNVNDREWVRELDINAFYLY